MYIIIGCCTKQSDDFDCVKTDMPHGRDPQNHSGYYP